MSGLLVFRSWPPPPTVSDLPTSTFPPPQSPRPSARAPHMASAVATPLENHAPPSPVSTRTSTSALGTTPSHPVSRSLGTSTCRADVLGAIPLAPPMPPGMPPRPRPDVYPSITPPLSRSQLADLPLYLGTSTQPPRPALLHHRGVAQLQIFAREVCGAGPARPQRVARCISATRAAARRHNVNLPHGTSGGANQAFTCRPPASSRPLPQRPMVPWPTARSPLRLEELASCSRGAYRQVRPPGSTTSACVMAIRTAVHQYLEVVDAIPILPPSRAQLPLS